jgi:hypothetical protein
MLSFCDSWRLRKRHGYSPCYKINYNFPNSAAVHYKAFTKIKHLLSVFFDLTANDGIAVLEQHCCLKWRKGKLALERQANSVLPHPFSNSTVTRACNKREEHFSRKGSTHNSKRFQISARKPAVLTVFSCAFLWCLQIDITIVPTIRLQLFMFSASTIKWK